jgi:hypothetical protein
LIAATGDASKAFKHSALHYANHTCALSDARKYGGMRQASEKQVIAALIVDGAKVSGHQYKKGTIPLA